MTQSPDLRILYAFLSIIQTVYTLLMTILVGNFSAFCLEFALALTGSAILPISWGGIGCMAAITFLGIHVLNTILLGSRGTFFGMSVLGWVSLTVLFIVSTRIIPVILAYPNLWLLGLITSILIMTSILTRGNSLLITHLPLKDWNYVKQQVIGYFRISLLDIVNDFTLGGLAAIAALVIFALVRYIIGLTLWPNSILGWCSLASLVLFGMILLDTFFRKPSRPPFSSIPVSSFTFLCTILFWPIIFPDLLTNQYLLIILGGISVFLSIKGK